MLTPPPLTLLLLPQLSHPFPLSCAIRIYLCPYPSFRNGLLCCLRKMVVDGDESSQFIKGMIAEVAVSSVRGSVKEFLADTTGEKRRNFVEIIEFQISLKNYNPQRDKRFSGTVRLPHVPRPHVNLHSRQCRRR
ncbi:hypothetical protein BDQ12DRAFT_692984 [Crucibulum laeve]|uniref:Uncharacterized protein n=1 Tax=Crucibulum laeve TaxID=68775 RepID=A0A5C3LJM2_9AGAR|nr:hypothetical protein BDQ12DRAFT_692984 [Crucibulum laeve]